MADKKSLLRKIEDAMKARTGSDSMREKHFVKKEKPATPSKGLPVKRNKR